MAITIVEEPKILLAVLVVVILLAISFRSVRGVVFPLVGLSFALIWTYGILNLAGSRFTALEVAVAPLVLGLGIDYSIHLQRRYNAFRSELDDSAESWLASCARLSTPLGLAVITTVAAFLANIISPLPPLETFGIALAVGVISAFINATIVVGALHVVLDKSGATVQSEPIRMPRLSKKLVDLQRSQQAIVFITALIISGASIIGAMGLETEFDLTDFLDDDMEIMEVRNELDTSYESAGWKVVYVLMEPASDSSEIDSDQALLTQLRKFDGRLGSNYDVVGGGDNTPSYEGPYNLLYDAVENNKSFGILFFIVFMLIAVWPVFESGSLRVWAIALSSLFLFLGIINSRILTPLKTGWIKLGEILGKVVAPVVMGFIYFIIITPIGIFMRLIGKDLLNLKFNKNKSYWIKRVKNVGTMKRQF